MEDKSTVGQILDRPLPRNRVEVSLSSFSYLFAELVKYWHSKVESIADLETKLADTGYGIGLRQLELLTFRDRLGKRERNIKSILTFIKTTLWKSLLGKTADRLEKSRENDDEYYLYDDDAITNRFIWVPKDQGQLNCAAFLGGIINGVLDGADFPCEVSTHFTTDTAGKTSTAFVLKFEKQVVERDKTITG